LAGTLEFGYGAIALTIGIWVLGLASHRRANQALSWLLIVEGIGMGELLGRMRLGFL
jgi:hypothetical protein